MNKENNVFVIDSNTSARIGLKRLLIAAGYKVDAYSSGREFLNSVDSKVSGCLVLDAGITGLSYKDLLEEFTKREIRLYIIVISAGSGPETKKFANEMNAVGFFHKPVDGTALIDAIDWALRSRKISNDRKKTFNKDI